MAYYPLKWITNNLAVGYAPGSDNDILSLKQQGIQAIVNLCAECYDLHEIEQSAGFNVLTKPISTIQNLSILFRVRKRKRVILSTVNSEPYQ